MIFYSIIIVFSIFSFSTKETFLTSQILDAASDSVVEKSDRNTNYLIKIRISNLAEPKRVQRDGNNY